MHLHFLNLAIHQLKHHTNNVLNFDVSQIKSDKKFFAFGFDAIALAPQLQWLQSMQNQKIESMSGYLSIDSKGIIHRDLAWGQYQNGRPVLLPPLVDDTMDLSETETIN